jgi:hypothetical protein
MKARALRQRAARARLQDGALVDFVGRVRVLRLRLARGLRRGGARGA